MTDLDRLIEAAEAGTVDNFGSIKPGYPTIRGYAEHAYRGSLDAALSLMEALLPGWDAYISAKGRAEVDPDEESDSFEESGRFPPEFINDNPARALLLAVLKAYRETRG